MLLNRASAFGVPVTVDATDFAAKMVEAAAQRLGGRARRVFLADATAFPPELANTYDALVSNFGIYLVPDVPKAVLEAHRLLRPGGFLAFTLWDYDDMHKLLHQLVALVTPPCPPPVAAHIEATVRRICDVTAAEAAMHAAGFSSVCVRPLTTATVVPDLRAFFEVIMLIPLRAEAFAGVAEPGPARDTFLDKAVQLAEATLGHEEPRDACRRVLVCVRPPADDGYCRARAFFEVITLILLRAEAFAGVAEPGAARDTFLDKAVQLAEATLDHVRNPAMRRSRVLVCCVRPLTTATVLRAFFEVIMLIPRARRLSPPCPLPVAARIEAVQEPAVS
eukprot:gene5082-7808_t